MAIGDAEGTFHSMCFFIESGIATMIGRNKNNFLGLVLTEQFDMHILIRSGKYIF